MCERNVSRKTNGVSITRQSLRRGSRLLIMDQIAVSKSLRTRRGDRKSIQTMEVKMVSIFYPRIQSFEIPLLLRCKTVTQSVFT